MSKTVAELISVLALKAGIPADDATLKAILSTEGVAKAEIPSEFHDKVSGALFSENAARNNPELFKHFTDKALANVKSKLGPLAKEILEGDSIQLFEQEADTYKKFDLLSGRLAGKLADLKKAADEAGKGQGSMTETQKLQLAAAQAEVQRLSQEMAAAKADYEGRLSGKENEFAQLRLSETARRLIAGQPWSDQYRPEDRVVLGESKFRSRLEKEGVTAVLNSVGEIEFKKADGLDYLDSVGQKMTFDSFFTPILSENNYLKASNGNPAGDQNGGGQNTGYHNGSGNPAASGRGLTPAQQAAFDKAESYSK